MRLAIVTPTGEGDLGVSLGAALAVEGHEVELVPDVALTCGSRELVRARELGREAPLTAALTRELAGSLAALHPEVVLVMRGRFLAEADVRWLRAEVGAPLVNYATDNPLFRPLREPALLQALPEYDLVVAFSARLVTGFRRLGAPRTEVIRFAYDPELYPPRPAGLPYRYDACFLGSWNPVRQEHLGRLAGLELAIGGGGWAEATRRTPLAASVLPGSYHGRAAAEVYWASRVGLNVLHASSLGAHNMRSFELPATRTATVATWTPEHERLYGPEGAVLLLGPEELREAVTALLADGERRERVAEAGFRAVERGTYRARARELARHLERLGG